MKHMSYLATIVLGCTLSLSAQSAETVRLVFSSNSGNAISASTNSPLEPLAGGCVSSLDGTASWCLPEQSGQISAASHSGMKVVQLDAQGYSAQYIADRFNQAGGFGLVEVDTQISARPESVEYDISNAAVADVNDPAFASYQKPYYFADIKTAPSGVNILGLWESIGLDKLKSKSNALDVLVLDSEFETSPDVVYFDGRSFSTTALTTGGPAQLPGDDYSVRDEVDSVCDAHGLQVSSVVNGTIDNAYGQAGITNNVNLYALRVMTCGTGFLSDSANALKWAAKKTFENSQLVTPYAGKPGIINMSLSGSTTTCPVFMQTAIDEAIAAGFTIVVAAGNQSGDSALRSPGNCAGVITVAAVNREGMLPSFTNRGANVTVSAAGTTMPTPCEDSDVTCLTSGTSVASPLVAGILAVIKQETAVDDATLKMAIKVTSNTMVDQQCQVDDVCGSGQIDAKAALDFAKKSASGELHTIEHALASKTSCEQAWMVDYFGNAAPLCQQYNVSLMAGYHAEGLSYTVYSADIASGSTPNWVELGQFQTSTFTLSNVDVANKKYGVKICDDGACEDIIMPINTEKAVTPRACQ